MFPHGPTHPGVLSVLVMGSPHAMQAILGPAAIFASEMSDVQCGPTGFTPEIEVLNLLCDRCHGKDRKSLIKQHTDYTVQG